MVILRLFVLVMAISVVLYFSISMYARGLTRASLIRQWAADLRVGDRDAWLKEELAVYDRSLKRRLIYFVFVLPLVFLGFIAMMLYVQNYM